MSGTVKRFNGLHSNRQTMLSSRHCLLCTLYLIRTVVWTGGGLRESWSGWCFWTGTVNGKVAEVIVVSSGVGTSVLRSNSTS